MSDIFQLTERDGPILIAMPHVGTALPSPIAARMTEAGRLVGDTDWYLDELYQAAAGLDCSVLQAHYARYVVDLNRAPDDHALYPGKPNTGIVPALSFDGEALYQAGLAPPDAEIAERIGQYWRPYHDAIRDQLARLKGLHGFAILWDAHSIRAQVPRLFDGVLPDLNFGTNDGQSCDPDLSATVMQAAAALPGYSHVLNGRFKGGYTTRHYGAPESGIHAIQLEIAQTNYLASEAAPFTRDAVKMARLAAAIAALLAAARAWRPAD